MPQIPAQRRSVRSRLRFEAGILLGLAYTVTGRLWLPIGIHTGWNFAEGTIFGTGVSGGTTQASFLHGVLTDRH
jgi:membrane protease YdiL (CAAX protease family)